MAATKSGKIVGKEVKEVKEKKSVKAKKEAK
jgi:hypothetical protein